MIDYQQLEYLVLRFSFDELSSSQQSQITEEMSVASYEALRNTLLEAQTKWVSERTSTSFQTIKVPQKLQAAFQKKYGQQKKNVKPWFAYTIPLYQVVIAVTIVAIYLYCLWPTSTKEKLEAIYIPKVEYKIIQQIDTVYQEKIIYKTIIIPNKVKEKPDRDSFTLKSPIFAATSAVNDSTLEQSVNILAKVKNILAKNKGRKVGDHKELLDFIVQID